MDLKDFLSTMTSKERQEFADRVGTSARHLANISYGYKPCGEKLAVEIERETDAAVRCEQLRPDVDWGYIRGTQKQRGKLNA